MQIPVPGDLVSIDQEIDGVIINGNNGVSGFRWSLIKVMPDQNGLVLETYDPSALSNNPVTKGVHSPDKNWPKGKTRILVLTIGENIVEVVYNPDFISILSF